jgi:hypothetical protein
VLVARVLLAAMGIHLQLVLRVLPVVQELLVVLPM